MENYKESLEAQLKEIDLLIAKTEKHLEKLKNLPDKRIGTSKSNGCDQYFWIDRNSKKRKYAKTSEIPMLRKIAQKDYEVRLNRKLKRIKKKLADFIDQYDISEIERAFENMSEARKKLIVPIIEPDELFIQHWKEVEYEPMEFRDEASIFYTEKGVKVRSKSELLIANALEKRGIPYRYEYPIKIKGIGNVRPDFTCFNCRTRKEFIWEHFGMMDDMGYVNRNIPKLNSYEQSGYFPGENMITTFETSQNPLGSGTIKMMIEKYLL
ncbi:MAG: hypothetical protein K6E70_10505 [Butyrivibrio sp.]|nr:hypothetical protein [Butyrivibrio sp.]